AGGLDDEEAGTVVDADGILVVVVGSAEVQVDVRGRDADDGVAVERHRLNGEVARQIDAVEERQVDGAALNAEVRSRGQVDRLVLAADVDRRFDRHGGRVDGDAEGTGEIDVIRGIDVDVALDLAGQAGTGDDEQAFLSGFLVQRHDAAR